jgi:hypothetical protein
MVVIKGQNIYVFGAVVGGNADTFEDAVLGDGKDDDTIIRREEKIPCVAFIFGRVLIFRFAYSGSRSVGEEGEQHHQCFSVSH